MNEKNWKGLYFLAFLLLICLAFYNFLGRDSSKATTFKPIDEIGKNNQSIEDRVDSIGESIKEVEDSFSRSEDATGDAERRIHNIRESLQEAETVIRECKELLQGTGKKPSSKDH